MKKVMISSTVRDLPKHRDQVRSACERLGMFFPHMMENLTAIDANALEVSLNLVDEADIYVGVLGSRYGYVPDGSEISVTESEYRRAIEREIPRLMFLMANDHYPVPTELERGPNAEKLNEFKERVMKDRVVVFFNSPEDLRGHVLQALLPYRDATETAIHYESDIPAPPEPYIAHVYTLLQTPTLIGRKKELKLLTDWVTDPNGARIMSFVAIGGTGKSAVTWHWFKNIATQEMKPLAGQMWWSFYEPDATFENFVTRALTYVTNRSLEEIQQISAPDRESQLLAALNDKPFLFALDGFERLVIAYARMDAARLDDSQVGVERTLRKTIDPRVGRFLRKLAQTKNSRILISTRLYPVELETDGGDPIPGSARSDITGLFDEDAVELWRAFGVSGSRADLLPIFSSIGNHALLIQALAGAIKRYHRAPADFDKWRDANPQFQPIKVLGLSERMAHVLESAWAGLNDRPRQVLHILAAFRRPTDYDTFSALLVGVGKPCVNENELDRIWIELEDRGLLGWDRRANRYDLHPIVRGVVWGSLRNDEQRDIYIQLHRHFSASPAVEFEDVSDLDGLNPSIELYHALIGRGEYDEAYAVFRSQLSKAMHYRLNANRERIQLLEGLFPDGVDRLPRLNDPNDQAFTLNALALGYQLNGQPERAIPLQRRSSAVYAESGNDADLSISLTNLSNRLRMPGNLRESEAAASRALIICHERGSHYHEAICLYCLGLTLITRGSRHESSLALRRSQRLWKKQVNPQGEGTATAYLAQRGIWLGDYAEAHLLADRAWELAQVERVERDFILAVRLKGNASLGSRDFAAAYQQLHSALVRARAVNLIEEELQALTSTAELGRLQGDEKGARDLLEDVWEYAERGPYPIFHADALNVLAQIERDAGNTAAAIDAATKAYQLAWCDGPPYAYHWGLIKAQKHLEELDATFPEMPPFDESKFEPMPEVEINPNDEFHVPPDGTLAAS